MSVTKVIIICSLTLGLVCRSEAYECQFPEFMQSDKPDGMKRDWRTYLKEGSRHNVSAHWELAYGFYGANMRAAVLGKSRADDAPMPFTRRCIIKVTEGRFLVEHQDQEVEDPRMYGATRKFLCVEFIKHSDDVVQIRESEKIQYKIPKLCSDDRMKTNPWIIINRANLFNTRIDCPFSGGFKSSLFDKIAEKEVCGAYDGATRLESECMKGEGMMFRFRHKVCIPDELQMGAQQRVYCVANWDNGKFTNIIIRRDDTEDAWCFRYPTDNNGAFHAYLFRDMRCDDGDKPETDRYFRVTLVEDDNRTLKDLCVDDYEACSYWNDPCRHAGSIMQLTCAKRCGICDHEFPNTCTLPATIQGKWKEYLPNATSQLTVRSMHLDVSDLTTMKCIQWYRRPYTKDATRYEQMFVTTFKNGCRPRYTCAQFSKHSPSVLKYKLSQSEIWPWEGTTGVSVTCHPFKYKEDDRHFGSKYRSSHLKVLVADEDNHAYVKCKLPFTSMDFSATSRSGHTCDGTIASVSSNYFQVSLDDCTELRLPHKFACMDSSKHGYFGDHLLVAEVQGEVRSPMCWLLSADHSSSFYLIELEYCNSAAKDEIIEGRLQPLVTFAPKLTTTTSTLPPTTTPNNGSIDGIIKSLQGGYRIQNDEKRRADHPDPVVKETNKRNSSPLLQVSAICVLCALMFIVVSIV